MLGISAEAHRKYAESLRGKDEATLQRMRKEAGL
jgi:hypothetical protein